MSAGTVSLACKCLNINLDVDASYFKAIDIKSLPLNDKLSQDTFFNQEIQQVLRLTKVTKMLPSLVETRTIDEWSIEHCLNCNACTHAVMSVEKGASLVLVNTKLLTRPDIDALRKSNAYSKVYKIVILPNAEKEHRFDYLPAEVEKSIRALKQKADEAINTEAQIIEERIRIYTEEQLQMLTDFKERTIGHQKALARVLLKHQLGTMAATPTKPRSTKMELKQDDNVIRASSLRRVPDSFDQLVKTPSPQGKSLTMSDHSPTTARHAPLQKKSSLDAECLFDLEGMDDTQSFDEYEESDHEDNGIQIRQNRGGSHRSLNVAKSLPMDIPVYMTAYRSQINDDSDEDPLHGENTTDIAASIQALARSVNGDTVFGDLPRNRCRTNI